MHLFAIMGTTNDLTLPRWLAVPDTTIQANPLLLSDLTLCFQGRGLDDWLAPELASEWPKASPLTSLVVHPECMRVPLMTLFPHPGQHESSTPQTPNCGGK